ncbi:hypothetical protein ElyMa_006172400 [Elysia marginata]|uniref:Uncharacterized protein n=1 Tax=Elysia marginata TaxID=1093978 RepID=A0AAV4GZH2_9GAST|nr:hypothetical protein ElyMa_006172400 [Elysia marginata]
MYCDLDPVLRRSPAPTPGAPDMLHRVQAYRGHPVQQLGFITASTTLLPLLSDRMRRKPPATLRPSDRLPATVRPSNSPSDSKIGGVESSRPPPGPVSLSSCTATPHEVSTSTQRSSPGPASLPPARHSQNTGRTTALPSQPAVAAELLPVDSVYPSQPGLLSPRLRI